MNHNGNLITAKKLVDAAKKCGADYIKFQTFNPNLMTTYQSKIAPYQKKLSLVLLNKYLCYRNLVFQIMTFQNYIYTAKKKDKIFKFTI